jgi:hypothetical protein
MTAQVEKWEAMSWHGMFSTIQVLPSIWITYETKYHT